MSAVRQLIVDGVAVPVYAMTGISQRYEPVHATYRARMVDGSGKQRTLWSGKLRTVITGQGLIPAGLSAIDFTASFTLSCVAHRAINSASRVITLPAARRSDSGSTPYGRAAVGDTWVDAPVASLVGDTLTLTEISGATQYQAVYFPELTVFADPPTEDHPEHGPSFSWSLTAEEL